jgi:ubiquinone/menaquinone biosynthesis C-methylase UbiE
MSDTAYALGHSPAEIQRLRNQGAMLRPITERLLLNAGIGVGMRVLDLGCGAGDVSMLAAELVGPSGSVVGIDRNQEVLAVAKDRVQAAGLPQINFVQASVEAFSACEPFDFVIGRYFLIHQAEPVALLHDAALLVRPGGVLAFHEVRLGEESESFPRVPLWDLVANLVRIACQASMPNCYAADRLVEHFSQAGLPHPQLFCEMLAGGGTDSPLYGARAEILQSLQPQLHRLGITSRQTFSTEGLERRLREAVVEADSQIFGFAQVCAWAQL